MAEVGAGGIWEIPAPSTRFSCKPKTALETESVFKNVKWKREAEEEDIMIQCEEDLVRHCWPKMEGGHEPLRAAKAGTRILP